MRQVPVRPPERRLTVGETVDTFETKREGTRRHIALVLVYLLAGVASSLIGLVAAGKLGIDEAKDLAASVLSPVIAVAGTALGFYFGANRNTR